MNFYTLFHKLKCLALISSCILAGISCKGQTRQSYNFDFEQVDTSGRPAGWMLSRRQSYLIRIDSAIHSKGRFSLAIQRTDSGSTNEFGVCTIDVLPPVQGKRLKLTGYIKTENVADGFAALWMRIGERDGETAGFDNMQNRGITGTHDWKEYSIELPYDPAKAHTILLGGLLVGKGRLWVDQLRLTIDGEPIEEVAVKNSKAEDERMETLIRQGSSALSGKLTPGKVDRLTDLGMLWGFLKYYHPAIASGKYDWDMELFRILPEVMAASAPEAYRIMEKWVDSLGVVPVCSDCKISGKYVKLMPDFGNLFKQDHLPASLVRKLAHIRDNRKTPQEHYYVGLAMPGKPEFRHEHRYLKLKVDTSVRLLALYRYWNIIQYFYPYRHLVKEDWNKTLTHFIPRFVNAGSDQDYALTCMELVAKIGDTHAGMRGAAPYLDSIKGVLITPFYGKFTEGKLVISGYYTDTAKNKESLKIGDVIERIDNTPVDALVKKYLPFTSASNYETQLYNLASGQGFLLRSNQETARLSVRRGNSLREVTVKRIPLRTIYTQAGRAMPAGPGYKLLTEEIGYVYPGKLKANDIFNIKKMFVNTKGVIIDLRCYPTFLPFQYGSWLKEVNSPFVLFTRVSMEMPGAVVYIGQPSTGGLSGTVKTGDSTNAGYYKGKLVIIVDGSTLSRAEYTAMALSTVPGSVVMGSRTAGADGDVSPITLPGGINTMISGIGVYYPDSTETQQVGVKIGLHAEPTIKGIQQGRDELLEKAVEWISAKKKAE